MNPLKLTFTANEQALTKTDNFTDFASNTVSYIEATFTLGENWTGYDSVRAVWKTDYYTISTVLDVNFTCVVPTEVLRYKAKVFVNLVGSIVENDALTDRLTTFPVLALTVKANAAVNGTETAPVTPSQFEQFVEAVQDAAGSISDYSYDSEAWAVGKRGGVDVPSTDETYHNNSKYWAEQNAGLSDEVADLKEDFNGLADEGIMYANFQQILNKGFDTSDGTFPDEANWDITSFIPVTPNEIIYVYNPIATHSYNGWYQADKTYIGNFKIAKGDIVELIVPSNAHYMVLTNNHNNFVYKVWRYPKELATLTDVDDISAKTENLLEERWNSGYINADGSISLDTPSVHSLHSLNYNPCKANTAYYVYNGGTDSINIVWYDSSRAIISRELITTSSGVVTSPANAVYFKMSLYNYGTTYNHNIAVFEGASPKGYIPSISASDVIAERNLDVFIERLCNNNYRKVDVSQINNVQVYSSYNSETQGSDRARITELSGYTTYCFYAPHDANIFVGDLSVYQYYAITKLESPKPPWVSGTGLKYMDGSSVSRIRKSENNLPSVASPLSVSNGTLLCITVKTDDVPPYLYIKISDEPILKDGIAGDIMDVEMHSNYFYYYVPAKNGNYLRYKFVHYTDNDSNADGLVQRVVDLVASDKSTVIMPVVADGEWEMAVMLEDRPDFIGCMNHGSEVSSIANIYFDGEKQSIVDGMKFSCRKIEATNKLTMYDPNDETTVVGYHYKKYVITANGVEVDQRIDWIADNTAMKSYVLMMPAVRGKDTTSARQVTDTFFDDKTFTEYAVGTTTMEAYPQAQNDKGNSVNLYGKTSGVFINTVCEIENKPQSAFTYLSNSVYYNKIYVSYCGDNYPIASGDVWKWKSKYAIMA